MKKFFIAAAVLLCAAAFAFPTPRKAAGRQAAAPRAAAPRGGLTYRPAGTVAFANLETIARTVAGIAGPVRKSGQVLLGSPAIPHMTYMRSYSDLDLVKRWTVVYPTTMTRAAFLQRHPTATPDALGTLRVPPGPHSRRTLWAWFAPDGKWAVLGPTPAMAANAYSFSARARQRPLGRELAYVQMDASGARALFGSDVCAGGMIAVRMGVNGLELRGSGRMGTRVRRPLPPAAHSSSASSSSSRCATRTAPAPQTTSSTCRARHSRRCRPPRGWRRYFPRPG